MISADAARFISGQIYYPTFLLDMIEKRVIQQSQIGKHSLKFLLSEEYSVSLIKMTLEALIDLEYKVDWDKDNNSLDIKW